MHDGEQQRSLLPGFREELHWNREDGAWRIGDPVLGREVRFVGREAELLDLLGAGPAASAARATPRADGGQPATIAPDELTGFLTALQRLHLLLPDATRLPQVQAMRRLLVAPLPARQTSSQPLSAAQARAVRLLFHPEVRYRCAGCGVCCRSFLLGPLRPADTARLAELRWPPGVRLPVGEQALHYLEDEGEPVPFLRTFKGQCVYLDAHGLCQVHAQAGEPEKPLVCRLFPFTFVRLGPPGSAPVAVSIQFESRALWDGHATSPPIQAQEPYLRDLLQELAVVTTLPERVQLAPRRTLPLRQALALDAAALRLLEQCPAATPPAELARRVLAPWLEALGPVGKGGRGAPGPAPALPPLQRWLDLLLAWQQEIETGLVQLLPATLAAHRELLGALERRGRGEPPGPLASPEIAGFCRSWLRAALHGRDAYRTDELTGGLLAILLRFAVTALLAGPAAGEPVATAATADPPPGAAAPGPPGMPWILAAIRASKLFQLGHSPERAARWLLADLPPHQQLFTVIGWLAELEQEGRTPHPPTGDRPG